MAQQNSMFQPSDCLSKRLISRLFCMIFFVIAVIESQAGVIDFESIELEKSQNVTSLAKEVVIEGGVFSVQSEPPIMAIMPSNPVGNAFRFSCNGTQSLSFSDWLGGSHPLTLQREDGGVFQLVRFDASEFFKKGDFAWNANAKGLSIQGFTVDGRIIEHEVEFDMISDGLGGISDFETFLYQSP